MYLFYFLFYFFCFIFHFIFYFYFIFMYSSCFAPLNFSFCTSFFCLMILNHYFASLIPDLFYLIHNTHSKFFLAYRKVDVHGTEVLKHVFVPFTRPLEYMSGFKQSRRREDDISIVTSGMRVHLKPDDKNPNEFVVADINLSYGGVAAVTACAVKTQEFLMNRVWNEDTLSKAYEMLTQDFPLPPQVVGGQPEYRASLAASFLFKFFVMVCKQLEAKFKRALIPDSYNSAITTFHRPPSHGIQTYTTPVTPAADPDKVGKSLMHLTAPAQVTGEAKYVDDLPTPVGGLYAALVLSSQVDFYFYFLFPDDFKLRFIFF